ncbi:MAG: amino acid ABC transporter substrate-binding protein [Burkholderiaceae bacterium]|nr:amino acid ABC transporter substrate-binding protein [Burkholderiaceae bacterium]
MANAAVAQQSGTLDKIKASGQISLGVRDSSIPLSYTVGNGKYVGFHTEMAERIVDDLSKLIGKPIKIVYTPMTSANRMPLVENGTVDLGCGSATNTVARKKEVAFANTTYVEEMRMAVKANSGINGIPDLNGKKVVTTTGTNEVQTVRKDQAKNIDFHIVYGKDHADSFLMLATGRADAFVMDQSILAGNIASSKNPGDFKIVGPAIEIEPIACMLRKNDTAFQKAVNDSIARQIADGSLAKLYDKWFMQPIPPNGRSLNMPLSDATKEAWALPNDKSMEDYSKK